MSERPAVAEPGTFVIFGGTGDLSRRKLLPALGRLAERGRLPPQSHILGVGRDKKTSDAAFRDLARASLEEAKLPTRTIEDLLPRIHFHGLGAGEPADYVALRQRLERIEADGVAPNRAFYLALPPGVFERTLSGLGEAGLNRAPTGGSCRVVLEKPFGHDLGSARALNEVVHRVYDEGQVYRIDHYLGKEAVQNLLVFRFGNVLFESMWNRDRIQGIQITVAESLGVGSRAAYYDHSGALRDMVQNHLMQVLSLVAMEVPATFDADSIRFEKIKVLKSIGPILPNDVVFGQYGPGEVEGHHVAGYLSEKDIPPSSRTETFAAMRLWIDNWRWQGVPFFLRTGKRMPKRTTNIAVRLKNAPVCLFESMGSCLLSPNVLLITLQPDEGFSLHIDVKRPGSPMELQRIPLQFKYRDVFDSVPEAYDTLLGDVLRGDQTLFVHSSEVEESWRLLDGLIREPPPVQTYPAGSWGPRDADSLMLPERELWG